MNKLKEILEEFEDNFAMESSYKVHDRLKKFLQEKLVQYARSVTYNVRLEADKHQVTTRKILDRIDQDLLSLKEKNI